MDEHVKTLYLCYLTTEDGKRVEIIYNFLQTQDGRDYFNNYSTDKDTIKKFWDSLRFILKDEKVM